MTNRPSLKKLCGIDTSKLQDKLHPEALKEIISSLKDERTSVAVQLYFAGKSANYGYEKICELNTKLMYLDKAIGSRTQDYEEMMNAEPEFTGKIVYSGQSKKHSHLEAIANQIAGFVIGWSLVYFAFPMMGVETTVAQASMSSAMFFVASYARSYSIRRIFNKLHIKGWN